jgi:uncharacterized protein YecT (DUF1311 family)
MRAPQAVAHATRERDLKELASVRSVLAAVFLFAGLPGIATAQAVRPDDRNAIDTCLRDAGEQPQRCIRVVYDPCTETREGGTTVGMQGCASRETAVWTEKLETALRSLRTGRLGQTEAQPWNRPRENARERSVPGSDILDDMQKTWLVWRAKKCDALAMQAEGGTLSRVLYAVCFLDETARHALWLETLLSDTTPR